MPRIRATRLWHKIGIELEGAWSGSSRTEVTARVKGAAYHSDGSVYGTFKPTADPTASAPALQGYFSGEIVTSPIAYLEKAVIALEALYPDGVNSQCGLHIHMSFRDDRAYQMVCTDEFYRYYLARWKQWGERMNMRSGSEFWKRLDGENRFCEAEFRPERQLRMTSKGSDRYAQLNYCKALHNTVENRMLPMFRSKALAVSALKEWISIVEDWTEHVYPAMESRALDCAVTDAGIEMVQTIDDTVADGWLLSDLFTEAREPVIPAGALVALSTTPLTTPRQILNAIL